MNRPVLFVVICNIFSLHALDAPFSQVLLEGDIRSIDHIKHLKDSTEYLIGGRIDPRGPSDVWRYDTTTGKKLSPEHGFLKANGISLEYIDNIFVNPSESLFFIKGHNPEDSYKLYCFFADNGKALYETKGDHTLLFHPVTAEMFMPGYRSFYNQLSGKKLHTLNLPANTYMPSAAYSPLGNLFAYIISDLSKNDIFLCDPKTKNTLGKFQRDHDFTPRSLNFSPCGKYLLSGGWGKRGYSALKAYNVTTKSVISQIEEHSVKENPFSRDGNHFISTTYSDKETQEIHIRESQTGNTISTITTKEHPEMIGFTPRQFSKFLENSIAVLEYEIDGKKTYPKIYLSLFNIKGEKILTLDPKALTMEGYEERHDLRHYDLDSLIAMLHYQSSKTTQKGAIVLMAAAASLRSIGSDT